MGAPLLRLILCLLCLAAPAHADWRDEVIYFVMIDRFADGDPDNNAGSDPTDPLAFHRGDLRGITAHLPYIAGLGATALWITPVVQQTGPVDHDGKPFFGHHGYWADDFTRLDPRFGTEADLVTLVAAAHARGLKVLLDVVYNHVGYGARWPRERPDWLRQGEDCGGDPITMCLAGLPDLRTDHDDVRRALFDAHIGLAERTGLDGFRLDTFIHVEPDFWAAHRAETRARLGDDFFLLGEIWDGDKYLARAPFAANTLDGVFDFSFRTKTLGLLTGVETPARYARYFSNRATVADGHVMAPFLSNHDMPTLLAMLRGDVAKLRIALALLAFAEGPPVISWGEEIGRRGGVWPNNREDMDWAGGDGALLSDVTALLALRHARADMRGGAVETISTDGHLLVLRRGDTVLAVNLGEATAAPRLPAGAWNTLYGPGSATALPPVSVTILAPQ